MNPLSAIVFVVCFTSCLSAALHNQRTLSDILRVRRQINMAQGGGVGMSVSMDPRNTRDPVNFAIHVDFADAISGMGVNHVDTISNTNTGGFGRAQGNAMGAVNGGRPFASADGLTWVPSPQNGQAFTNNMGFSNVFGDGFAHGGSSGFAG